VLEQLAKASPPIELVVRHDPATFQRQQENASRNLPERVRYLAQLRVVPRPVLPRDPEQDLGLTLKQQNRGAAGDETHASITYVALVAPESLGAASGFAPGDQLLSVEGVPVADLPPPAVLKMMCHACKSFSVNVLARLNDDEEDSARLNAPSRPSQWRVHGGIQGSSETVPSLATRDNSPLAHQGSYGSSSGAAGPDLHDASFRPVAPEAVGHAHHVASLSLASLPASAHGSSMQLHEERDSSSQDDHQHADEDALVPVPSFNNLQRCYPGSDLVRLEPLVVDWSQTCPGYHPRDYTDSSVFANHRTDAAQTAGQLTALRFNEMDGTIDRRSHEGVYDVSPADHRPLCPLGRTGIRGRGLFCHWGPNHAVHILISRWAREVDGTMKIQDQRPVLEFLALKHPVTKEHYLPGVFVRPGEPLLTAIERALHLAARGVAGAVAGTDPEKGKLSTMKLGNGLEPGTADAALHGVTADVLVVGSSAHTAALVDDGVEESGLDGVDEAIIELMELVVDQEVARIEIYRGALEDPRNTDNAWLETVALNFHDETGLFHGLEFGSSSPHGWMTAFSGCSLCPEQLSVVHQLASAHQAYFVPRRKRTQSGDTVFSVELNKTGNSPFGFSISTSAHGHHRVAGISQLGLAFNVLKERDEIVEINHVPVSGWSHADVKAKIVGNANLLLKIRRQAAASDAGTAALESMATAAAAAVTATASAASASAAVAAHVHAHAHEHMNGHAHAHSHAHTHMQ
jgi:ADP-ribose pyrophosphatase